MLADVERAGGHVLDRLDEHRRRLGLQEKTVDPGPQRLDDVLLLGVSRQEDNLRRGRHLPDFTGGIQTIQERHLQVEHGHVRLELLGEAHRLPTVKGLPGNLYPRALQERPQPLDEHRVVVGEKNS